ncbi:uncharacterized protein LOC129806687 [Phlebotomus papatasi]|uniref:uncharacterized protein LOC129806687 n=1 Tax=Phlebotomus papatasi TaxID=29031 RepID=UPI002484377A|nr:uncharacterized protein LOC129806687 [Phlebotomus papatasi]
MTASMKDFHGEETFIVFVDNSDDEECFGAFQDRELIEVDVGDDEEISQEKLNPDLGETIPTVAKKSKICILFPDNSDDEECFAGFDENVLMAEGVNVAEAERVSQENLITYKILNILLAKNIFACGTVQKNRKNLPELNPDKKMKRGHIDWQCSGRIVCVKWMDNRSVMLLSNYMSPTEMVKVQRRQSGTSQKLELNCLKIVHTYNQHMNGVDIMDQKKSYYEQDRKCAAKFYLKLFFDILDIGINNACIVYNEMSQEKDIGRSLTLLQFRQEVARCLIGDYRSRTRAPPTIRHSNELLQPLQHCPVWIKIRSRCHLCYTKNKVDSRTFCKCEACGVYLCFNSTRNCFKQHHDPKSM